MTLSAKIPPSFPIQRALNSNYFCQRFREEDKMLCLCICSAQNLTALWLHHSEPQHCPKSAEAGLSKRTWRDRCSCWLCDLHINLTPVYLKFPLTPTSVIGEKLPAMELLRKQNSKMKILQSIYWGFSPKILISFRSSSNRPMPLKYAFRCQQIREVTK